MSPGSPDDSNLDGTRRAFLATATATALLLASRPVMASGDSEESDDSDASNESGGDRSSRDWPMAGGDAGNTFHRERTAGPSQRLRLAWQYDGVYGTPIVADGVAYLRGRRPNDPTDHRELHAIDLETRERKWWTTIPGRVFAEPAVADGTVYVNSEDEGVFALDAATGELRWRYRVTEDTYGIGPPTAEADGVYVPHDGRILALTPDGELRWRRFGDFETRFPAAVADGLVYVAYNGGGRDCNRGPGLWALDAETGECRWTYAPRDNEPDARGECGSVTMPPAVADGTVYTCVQTDDDRYWDLIALDAPTGRKRWERPIEGGMFGTVAVANGTVYVPLTQRLVALDAATGEDRWRRRIETADHVLTSEYCVSTPTIANGTVYLGEHNGRIHALDAETGERHCEYALGSRFDLRRPPTVVDGTIYVTGMYDADQRRQPGDMHLFALAEAGDGSVSADFEMKRSEWEIPGQSDHFRTGHEMGFYAGRSQGPITKYEWDLTGDGEIDSTGRLVTHTYDAVGSKTVTLRVTSETGATDSISKTFYVTD